MKIKYYTAFLLVLILGFVGCKKSETDIVSIPERDRAEQQLVDKDSLLGYLSTHYYNASTFDTPGNYKMSDLVISELPKDGSGNYLDLPDPDHNTLLIDDIEIKTTTLLSVEYEYYILRISQGGGTLPNFTDTVKINYSGNLMDENVFDSTVNPVALDLVNVISGWRKVIPLFQTAVGPPTIGNDGKEHYDNYGFGVMFLPSGLAYYGSPPSGIPVYSNLIFKFQIYQTGANDHDNDGLFSHLEDIDGNGNVNDDDTDGDNIPNYLDANDDGDSLLTKDELVFKTYTVDTNQGEQEPVLAANEYEISRSETSGVLTIKTVVIVDSNNDGIPDYLDKNTVIDHSSS
ncbi:FKBP-type peptidyl-prolyl cis-trans isomerase [Flavobacteriaceae bacterium LMO-SS05]